MPYNFDPASISGTCIVAIRVFAEGNLSRETARFILNQSRHRQALKHRKFITLLTIIDDSQLFVVRPRHRASERSKKFLQCPRIPKILLEHLSRRTSHDKGWPDS